MDWVNDLLDLGIGALAAEYLYKHQRGLPAPRTCPHCGKEIKKYARRCPHCGKRVN